MSDKFSSYSKGYFTLGERVGDAWQEGKVFLNKYRKEYIKWE